MRLDKYLSDAGIGTRSEVKKILRDSRISVNDLITIKAKDQIDPNKDIVKLDNKIIEYKAFRYFVLNKPKGYVSANNDNLHPNVLEFFNDLKIKHLSHVGRLDLDTTGVLLISNDGKLSHYLISPKSNVKKIYEVRVDKPLDNSLIIEFAKGIKLDNGELTRPSKLKIIDEYNAELTLTEGKYHQVKRMMRAVGYNVINLNRKLFAFLTVKNTKPGEYYELSKEEIDKLKEYMR